MRVRAFTQDDGHIFCTPEQIQAEVHRVQSAGARASTRTSASRTSRSSSRCGPTKRIGADASWDRAEGALRAALKACGAHWTELPGEGAFYGPKIEYHLKDSIGRSWQCGTMQVDFPMPGSGSAPNTSTEDNTRKVPVMLHRAIVGSLERFIGILIEHYAGALPAVAGPGPGGRADHHRPAGRVRPRG